MSIRHVIEHALRVYYVDSAEPAAIARDLLAQYDAEVLAERDAREKDTRGGSPRQGESTHPHPRPCEFPEVLPCRCVRPHSLPEAAFLRARRRALVSAYFEGSKQGHAEGPLWAAVGDGW